MNILFLTDRFPYPISQGENIVSLNWIRELAAKGHDLTLLSLRSPANDAHILVLEEMGVRVIQSPETYRRDGYPLRWFTSRLPMSILRVSTEDLLAEVKRVVDQHAIEIIVLISATLVAFQTVADSTTPIVAVPIDSISLNLRRRREHMTSLLWKTYTGVEISKWEYVEAEYCSKAASCIVVTADDAQNLCKNWPESEKDRVAVIPLGVDTAYFKPNPAIAEDVRKLVFTGVMSTSQSVISLEWFLNEVFPLLQDRWDDLSMDIVGRDPAQRLFELASMHENVHVVGEVPDLRPYIAQAAVYVAPMIIGSGAKTRLLEAMAMGKAVVATPRAASGIEAGDGEAPLLIVEADAAQFARRVSDLLANSELRRSTGELARRYVVDNQSWSAVGNALDELLAMKFPSG